LRERLPTIREDGYLHVTLHEPDHAFEGRASSGRLCARTPCRCLAHVHATVATPCSTPELQRNRAQLHAVTVWHRRPRRHIWRWHHHATSRRM
jgi:hypothetical protein